jgi:hypothetical protein
VDLPHLLRFMCEVGADRTPGNVAAAIRLVQRLEGNQECFGSSRLSCAQVDCSWRTVCPAARDARAAPRAPGGTDLPRRRWGSPALAAERGQL